MSLNTKQQMGNGDGEPLSSANHLADGGATPKALFKNDESSQPSTPSKSPTKSTPTKSRNKKKNEARKRNQAKKQATAMETNNDNQQQQPDILPAQDLPTMVDTNVAEQRASDNDQQPSAEPADDPLTKSSSSSPTLVANNGRQQQPSPQQQAQNNSPSPNPVSTSSIEPTASASVNSKATHDSNSWRRRQREIRDLREQLKIKDSQLQLISERTRQQMIKIKELETSLATATRTCNQFEKRLQEELNARKECSAKNAVLNMSFNRLKTEIGSLEKSAQSNDELIRSLTATLLERDTELAILKLKMTCLQTNPSASLNGASSYSSIKQQKGNKTTPLSERSNSEFCRNSYVRSSMMAEAASVRSSTGQLKTTDRDASIWAQVPVELTPSKRPLLLERSFQPIYSDSHYDSLINNESQAPIVRDRRYKTLPRSMKSPPAQELSKQEQNDSDNLESSLQKEPTYCLITNLDDSNSTNQSIGGNKTLDNSIVQGQIKQNQDVSTRQSLDSNLETERQMPVISRLDDASHLNTNTKQTNVDRIKSSSGKILESPIHPSRSPSTPVKSGFLKILGKFMRSDSSSGSKNDLFKTSSTSSTSAFQRGATRSTLVGPPNNIRAQLTPIHRAMDFKTDKPFADWDTNMLVDWLTVMGLSMYANQCRRCFKCGAQIMNATPTEVDKGLGITNHLHRKKLRLAISELNGDCDKITKAAAKLDYLWVARWLDDIGLPQHKEAFINGRVDGRVLNYLTVEDLLSMGIKSVLHHSSIRCGIRVLRSIGFDWTLLKRRATAEEIEQMNSMRQKMETDESGSLASSKNVDQQNSMNLEGEISLWTCHRVMEWLRMIDFAEFAPNLRGSGVHGGLIMFEDGFTVDTLCLLLSIPTSKTLLRRHLSSFFEILIGSELAQRKRQYKKSASNQQINPAAEIKAPKKSPLWLNKLKSSKVGQDGMDDYLCPMYPVEPQISKSGNRKSDSAHRESTNLPRIPESINV